MSNYEIISKEPISNAEVFEAIEEKVKAEAELTYREEKTHEYIKKFNPLTTEKFNEAVSEIQALDLARLDVESIIKIVELMPKSGTELRAIVSNAGIVLVDDSVTQVLDVLSKYN